MLTLAQIAHPVWGINPQPFDVVAMLMAAIGGLDLVRAQLLVQHAYKTIDGQPTLQPFDAVNTTAPSTTGTGSASNCSNGTST